MCEYDRPTQHQQVLNPHEEPASHRYAGPEPRYHYCGVCPPSWIRSKSKALLGDLEYDLVVDQCYLVWGMEISHRDKLESSQDTPLGDSARAFTPALFMLESTCSVTQD